MANNELLINALSAALEAARASQDEAAIRQLETDLALALEQAEAEAETEAPEVEVEVEAETEAPEVEAPEVEVEAQRLQELLKEARRRQAQAEAETEAPEVEVEVEVEARSREELVEELSRKAAPFFRIISFFSLVIFIALIAALCSGGDDGEALDDGVYHVSCFSGTTVLFNGLSTGEDLKIKSKHRLSGKFFLFKKDTITAGKTAVPYLTGNCKVVKLASDTKYYNLVVSNNNKYVLIE